MRIIYILIMQTLLCILLAVVYGIECDIANSKNAQGESDNFYYFNMNYNGYPDQNDESMPYQA